MSKVRIYRRKGESPNWQAQVYVGGKRYRFSCHTSDKSTARGFAEQRAAALVERNNRGLVGLPEPVQISKVFERYEREYAPKLRPHARRRSLIVFKQARAWFTNGPLYDPAVQLVTARDIQAFLEEKHSQGVCGRTVNLYRANLHRLFQLCVRPWLLIPSNPVDGTEPMLHDPREPLLLSQRDYERLRAATVEHPMLRLFLTLAWETGARSGELLQLEPSVYLASGGLGISCARSMGFAHPLDRRLRLDPLARN